MKSPCSQYACLASALLTLSGCRYDIGSVPRPQPDASGAETAAIGDAPSRPADASDPGGPVPCGESTRCPVGEACTQGACAPMVHTCQSTPQCPAEAGVCRNGRCQVVTCADTRGCAAGEICRANACALDTRAVSGHTLAAGGSISTSPRHIHIGLSGQGRGVGISKAPSGRTHLGGSTVVLER